MYENILLPSDGLGKCVYGTCHAILMAKKLGAKITAVSVTENLPLKEIKQIYDEEIPASSSPAELAQGVKKRTEELNKELAGKSLEIAEKMCADNGVACDTVHITGESAPDALLKAAEERKCDLIYVSTHGNPGLMGTLFGDVATKIISNRKIPVLVHHCGGPA